MTTPETKAWTPARLLHLANAEEMRYICDVLNDAEDTSRTYDCDGCQLTIIGKPEYVGPRNNDDGLPSPILCKHCMARIWEDEKPELSAPKREAEIRARVEAACPLPWIREGRRIEGGDPYASDPDVPRMIVYDEGGHTEEDAEFITKARDDVPWLLDTNAALRAMLHDLLRTDQTISTRDALDTLATWGEHLISVHSCDAEGYEHIVPAVIAARAAAGALVEHAGHAL